MPRHVSRPRAPTPKGRKAPRDDVPLCVDLDGTLIRTDLLIESFFELLKRHPLTALLAPFWLLKGKANLKHQIAQRVEVDAGLVPYNMEFLAFLRDQRRRGRTLVLVTASHERFAEAVAAHLGIFDDVLATHARTNLSGTNKRKVLQDRYGDRGFDYAGNSRADLAVWRHARRALLVAPERGVRPAVDRSSQIERVFEAGGGDLITYLQAMRPHQWLKNLLVFVPLLAAHEAGNVGMLAKAMLAFLSFSLCASSVYLLNDLLDLSADRDHPRKRLRPFAAGTVSIKHGAILIPLLLLGGFWIGTALSREFLAVLGTYYVLTLAYSLWLKNKVLVDVLVLAGLYTLRVIAGAAAVVITPSFWLLAFSMFIFLSLALVKRYAELLQAQVMNRSSIKGRGYEVVDCATIGNLGPAAGYAAVLVLALYINSEDIKHLYSRVEVVWLLCPLLLYWVSRVWIKAGRGEMHDDPIVFAIRDRISRAVGAVAGIIVFLSA